MEDEEIEISGMNLSSPEYYKLVCCSTAKPLELNGENVIFEFTGQAYNENYPDKFLNKIIGEIITLSKIKIKGCWYLEDASNCDKELYKIIDWKSFFTNASIYSCCDECMPKEESEERIYLNSLKPLKPIDPCYEVVKNYVNLFYTDALQRMEGIKICCPPKKHKAIVQYERYIREKFYDPLICCPPCVQMRITLPANSNGSYIYTNCENDEVTVNINTAEALNQVICVSAKPYIPVRYEGTNDEYFLATPLGIACV